MEGSRVSIARTSTVNSYNGQAVYPIQTKPMITRATIVLRMNSSRRAADLLGQEASGAWFAGLRYGEGILYTKNAGDLRVYWQGPSLGLDFGGDGARTMMLVYSLPATDAIYQRFIGIAGSAYLIGGLGMTALTFNNVVVVPIRSGVGLRLGANIGYLKFTPSATWNPF
jgi:hypothetical protein